MRIPRYLKSTAGVFQACLFLLAMYLIWLESASASEVKSNAIAKPSLLDVLAGVLNERSLIQKTPQSPKARYEKPYNMKHSRTRSDLFRQELAKETEDNCLGKLLCGSLPNEPTPPSLAGDFGYLVKEFFNIFDYSDDPPAPVGQKTPEKGTANQVKDVDSTKDDEEDKAADDENDEEEDDSDGRSEKPDLVSISGSLSNFGSDTDNEVITTSTSATITEVTTGATLTELSEQKLGQAPDIHKMTLEELIGDMTLTPEAFERLRRSRSLQSAGEPRQSTYLKRKIRELQLASTETKKLKIARQIADTLRQPQQCKKFSNVASQVLSTCPLTAEVVNYFNSNLKNGSQIAIISNTVNATSGGLVLLNDKNERPHAYFLDSNPIVANTRITTDIKNPTVPERYPVDKEYQIYENAFPQIQNVDKVSLTKVPEKEKDADSDENDEDDDDDNEEDEEDEEEDEDTNDEDDQNDIDEDAEKRRALKDRKGSRSKQQGPQPTTLPPGMIKVYGIPQHSFDNEFSDISTQIGSGPIVIFDQDDFDANDPHPGPPVQPPRSRPVKIISNVEKTNRRRSQLRTTSTPIHYASDEESDENDQEEYDEARNVFSTDPSGPPTNYLTHSYGGPPGPPYQEYYRHGLPPMLRPQPYRTAGQPINISPESSVRGRLNFIPNPGAGLMRPGGIYATQNFRYFG